MPNPTKRSNYLLKIGNSCDESWAEMTPSDSGRFCANCAKNVIDFTRLSDDQVLAILRKSSGNLCGRLEEGQMNRYLMRKTEPSSRSRLYKIFAGLFLLTAANQSLAKIGITDEGIARQVKMPVLGSEKMDQAVPEKSPTDSLKNVIRGRVVDSLESYPIPGANILLEGTKLGTATDTDGKFELVIPSKLLKDKNTLVVSLIGYKTQALKVNSDDFSTIKSIVLIEDKQLLDEIVYVGSYKIHERKWWQFWKKKYCK